MNAYGTQGSASPLQITEILRRSEQGVTRPFLCRCEDDRLYYVKGSGAGPRSLLCEWLAGQLARAFDLPLPEFAIVQASQDLIDLLPEGSDLGTGPAFASLQVPDPQWLSRAHVTHVPMRLQQDVLVFDWWVRNLDRTLTELGGNPNLLWKTSDRRLVVIDHNAAFDREFDAAQFTQTHVFAKRIPDIFQDLVECSEYSRRLRTALAVWPVACQNVPDEWWFMDEERTIPTDFDPDAVLALLNCCTNEEFWRLPP
ncbi:MAG: HipA family kinase [Dokdonella sp.]